MNIFEEIQNMSEEEKQQLLDTDFGPELEKEASAELAKASLANSLYAYGAYMADVEIESQDELSKEASAEFEAAGSEIASAIEEGLMESGILETDDTVALHKEAQAAAAIMFQGYSDQMESMIKEAAKKKDPSFMKKMKGHAKAMGEKMHEAKEKAMEMAGKAGKHIAKNKGKYGAGAALTAAGLGALAYKKHHEKKASELTVEEISQAVAEEMEFNEVVLEGLDKLAAAGKAKAGKGMMEHLKNLGKHFQEAQKKVMKTKAAKHVAQHSGKYGLGAGALGGAAIAHKMHKED